MALFVDTQNQIGAVNKRHVKNSYGNIIVSEAVQRNNDLYIQTHVYFMFFELGEWISPVISDFLIVYHYV